MKIKPLLKRYIQFYKLYKKIKASADEKKEIKTFSLEEYGKNNTKNEEVLKHLILKDETIDKTMLFYDLAREDGRSLNGAFFSLGEAIACEAHMSRQRYTHRWSNSNLKEENKFSLIELSLSQVLEDDEKLSGLFKRMQYINPYDEDEIESIPDDFELKVLWSYEHHFEPQYIYYDGKDFISSTYKDVKHPWGIENGYTTMIDENGNYGMIYNAGGYHDIKLEIALNFEYFYIDADDGYNNGLVGIQKEKIQTDDYKEYLCEIIDLKTKEVYSKSALCGSLDVDNFIIIDENKNLQYVKIDTEKRRVEAKSKKYKSILNPIHYAPKPVQDIDTNLWGYIDNKCNEIIKPKFKDFGSFNDGYAIIKEDDKKFVIDIKGEVIIEPKDEIIHYDYELFFVRVGDKWAIYKDSEIYIDFIDTNEKIEKLKKEQNLKDDEVFRYLKRSYRVESGSMLALRYDSPIEILLRLEIVYKKRKLQKQMWSLPLKKYVKLYDTFKSEKDLKESGLWGREVKLKDGKTGHIGWSYPSSANMYDMSVELPVDSFGIALEELELVKDD